MTLFRQLPAWSPLTLGAILSGIRAAWFSDGVSTRHDLEQALRGRYAPNELYLTDSGTSALTLALKAVHQLNGAPVALPAYSCFDVATAADGAGVPFLLYDVDAGSLSPDVVSLRSALEAGARTVVVAHLYGVPVDLAAVQALAAEFGALIVEDAAQGSGCEWQGRPAGAHGALGVLSFGRGKGVTGGKGGALLVNHERLRNASLAAWESKTGPGEPRGTVRDAILLSAQWLFGNPWLYWIPASLPFLGLGETNYNKPRPIGGISSLAAGVLLRTLPLVPAEVGRRRLTALRYGGPEGNLSGPVVPSGWEAGWLRLPVVPAGTVGAGAASNFGAMGIMRGYPKSLADLPGFGSRRMNAGAEFPGARGLAERLITVPTHSFVRRAQVPVF